MDMLVMTMVGLGAVGLGKAWLRREDDGENAEDVLDEDLIVPDHRRGNDSFTPSHRQGLEAGMDLPGASQTQRVRQTHMAGESRRKGKSQIGREGGREGGSEARATLKRLHGVMTPARQDYFERAMRERAPKEIFYKAADGFDRNGLHEEARMLRARGDARDASPEVHEKRREVIRKAFQSRDPDAVEKLADVAEKKLGMTITAGKLREYAQGLRQAAQASRGQGGPQGRWTPDGQPYTFEDRDALREAGLGGALDAGMEGALPPGMNLAGERRDGAVVPPGTWLPPCPLNVGGECIVHGVGGCVVEAVNLDIPPSLEATDTAMDAARGFERGG